ncbi:MAG TPA: 3'-5' exonuclease, partial [Solirubrobacteraceae bacterium]|nr:3'-5' exonuclease [Solirubrobacteraceae bacterium]
LAGPGVSDAARGRIEAALSECLPDGLALPGSTVAALNSAECQRYREALAAAEQARRDERAREVLPLLGRLLESHDGHYQAFKEARGAVDFDDLELGALQLLRGDEALAASWAERFELVMVDEFQDTNPRQLALLACLERENVFTVGDAQQSIYGFRHADVEIFRRRRAELSRRGAHATLTRNFRSRVPVLESVNEVFAPRLGQDFAALVPGRPEPGGPPVELLLTDMPGWGEVPWLARGLPPAPAWRHAEARLLAQRVAELVAAGEATPGDAAVLVRAAGDLAVFERALEQQGLRTLAAGGRGYWSDQQVLDLLGYLRVLANPLDERALYGLLAGPLVGVSSDTLVLLGAEGRSPWTVLTESGPPEGVADDDHETLIGAVAWLLRERERAPLLALAEILRRAVRDRGYDVHVLALDGGPRRLANVHKLQRLARRFEQSDGRDLRGFLEHVAIAAEAAAREPDAPVGDDERGAIRLMTVHAAKGLEFGLVCVADLGRRGRTTVPDLLVDPSGAIGLQLAALDGRPAQAALDYQALRERRLAADAREEERILYVAMTRARERLILSGAANLDAWPPERPGAPALAWLGPALLSAPPATLREGPMPRPAGALRLTASTAARVGEVLREPPATGSSNAAPAEGGGAAPFNPSEPTPLPPPRTVSYSALSAHARCGYRYYLEHVVGLAAARGRAADRGTLAHLALERVDFDRLRAPDPAELARIAAAHGLRVGAAERAELAQEVGALAGSELAARLAGCARTRREHPFSFSPGPGRPLIVGVIDVLGYELDGGCLVIDYKTDRIDPGEELPALVGERYALQQEIYALAALRAGARRVQVAHWYLRRPHEPVLVAFEPGQLEALAGALGERIDALGRSRFAVAERPGKALCSGCPARDGLCSWPAAMI